MADQIDIKVKVDTSEGVKALTNVITEVSKVDEVLKALGGNSGVAQLSGAFAIIGETISKINSKVVGDLNAELAKIGTGGVAAKLIAIADAFTAIGTSADPGAKVQMIANSLDALNKTTSKANLANLEKLTGYLGDPKLKIPVAVTNSYKSLGEGLNTISASLSSKPAEAIKTLSDAITKLIALPNPNAKAVELETAFKKILKTLNEVAGTNVTNISNGLDSLNNVSTKFGTTAANVTALVGPLATLKTATLGWTGKNLEETSAGLKALNDAVGGLKAKTTTGIDALAAGLTKIKASINASTGTAITSTSTAIGLLVDSVNKIDAGKVAGITGMGAALDSIRKATPASTAKNLTAIGLELKSFSESVKDVGKVKFKPIADALAGIGEVSKAGTANNLKKIGVELVALAAAVTPDAVNRIKLLASELKKLGTANYAQVIASMKALTKQVDQLTANVNNIGPASKNAKVGMDQAGAGATDLMGRIKQLSQASALTTFSNMVDALVVLRGAFNFTKQFADFQYVMANIQALTGASSTAMTAMGEAIMKVGTSSLYSVKEAADAMLILASAGLTATEAITALPHVLDLATAGGISIAAAADTAVSAMFGLGMQSKDMGHIMDVLAVGAAKSNATIGSLSESLKNAAPAGKAANQSLESIVATTAALSNAGFKGATAGQNYKRMLMALVEPSQKASAVLDKLGVSIRDSQGEMRDFNTIISELGAAGMKLGEAKSIFGMWSGTAALAAATNTDAIRRLKDEMMNADGAMRNIASAMENTLTGAAKKAYNQLQALVIMLGSQLSGTITNLLQAVSWITTAMIDWATNMGPIQAMLLKFAAAIPILGATLLLLSSGFMRVVRAGALVTEYMVGGLALFRQGTAIVSGFGTSIQALSLDIKAAASNTTTAGAGQLNFFNALRVNMAQTKMNSAATKEYSAAMAYNNAVATYGLESQAAKTALMARESASIARNNADLAYNTTIKNVNAQATSGITLATIKLAFAQGGLVAGLRAAAVAIKAFIISMGPIGWLITAITLAAGAWAYFSSKTDEAATKGADAAKAMVQGIKDVETAQKSLNDASDSKSRIAASMELRNQLLDLAKANKDVSVEALAAMNSVDQFTGTIKDSGVAIAALKEAMAARAADNFLVEGRKGLEEYSKNMVKAREAKEDLDKALAKTPEGGIRRNVAEVINLEKAYQKAATTAEASAGQMRASMYQTADALNKAGKIRFWMSPEEAATEIGKLKNLTSEESSYVMEAAAKIREAELKDWNTKKERMNSASLGGAYLRTINETTDAWNKQQVKLTEITTKITALTAEYNKQKEAKNEKGTLEALEKLKTVYGALREEQSKTNQVAEKWAADMETATANVGKALDNAQSRLNSFSTASSKVDTAWKNVMDSMAKDAPTTGLLQWDKQHESTINKAKTRSAELAKAEEAANIKQTGMSEKKSKALIEHEDKKTRAILLKLAEEAAHYEQVYNKAKSKAEEYAKSAMEWQNKVTNNALETEEKIFNFRLSMVKNPELRENLMAGQMDDYKAAAEAALRKVQELDAAGDLKGSKAAMADLEMLMGKVKTGTEGIAKARAEDAVSLDNAGGAAKIYADTMEESLNWQNTMAQTVATSRAKAADAQAKEAAAAAQNIIDTKKATEELTQSIRNLIKVFTDMMSELGKRNKIDIEVDMDPSKGQAALEVLRKQYLEAFNKGGVVSVDAGDAMKKMEALTAKETQLNEKLKNINMALNPEDHKLVIQQLKSVTDDKRHIQLQMNAGEVTTKLTGIDKAVANVKSQLENLNPKVNPDEYKRLITQLNKLETKRSLTIDTFAAESKIKDTAESVDNVVPADPLNLKIAVDPSAKTALDSTTKDIGEMGSTLDNISTKGIKISTDGAQESLNVINTKINQTRAVIEAQKIMNIDTTQASTGLSSLITKARNVQAEIAAARQGTLTSNLAIIEKEKVAEQSKYDHEVSLVNLAASNEVITNTEKQERLRVLEENFIIQEIERQKRKIATLKELGATGVKELAAANAELIKLEDKKATKEEEYRKKKLAGERALAASFFEMWNNGINNGLVELEKFSLAARNAFASWSGSGAKAADDLEGFKAQLESINAKLAANKDHMAMFYASTGNLKQATNSLAGSFQLAFSAINAMYIKADLLTREYLSQRIAAEDLAKALELPENATEAMIDSARRAIGELKLLDKTTLDKLNGAIDKIKAAMVSFTEKVVGALKTLQDEWDNLSMSAVELEEKRYREQREAWDAEYAIAQKQQNQEAMRALQAQLLLIQQINAARMNQAIAADKKAKEDKAAEKPTGLALGGRVPGVGNGDVVPAMLTPGEYVVTKQATSFWGTNVLAAINNPLSSMGSSLAAYLSNKFTGAKYAVGGQVMAAGMPRLAFADGGQVPKIDLSNYNGGSTVGAITDAIQNLAMEARKSGSPITFQMQELNEASVRKYVLPVIEKVINLRK